MSRPLKKLHPFKRKRGQLFPGQSSDDDLDLGLKVRVVDHPSSTIINRELIRIGNIDVGRYVEIDQDGLNLYANGLIHVNIHADGDLYMGEDISTPGKTVLAVFANAQTYNSESMAAGDFLLGDNSSSKANILWDKSTGRLLFRGGQTTQLYLDTDGSLVAGAGDVSIDSSGIALTPGSDDTEKIKVIDGGTNIVEIYGVTDEGVSSQLTIIGRGKGDVGVDTPEGLVEIIAITHDGTAHSGAASVSISLTTSNDRATISASETRLLGDLEVTGSAVFNELSQDKDFRIESNGQENLFFVDGGIDQIGLRTNTPTADCILDMSSVNDMALRVPLLTTMQRDNLTASEGMIIYNSTTDKFQGYVDTGGVGSGWYDLM